MKLYDAPNSSQNNISDSGQYDNKEDDTPIFDKSAIGKSLKNKRDFSNLKV
jgi:hypothetical protein